MTSYFFMSHPTGKIKEIKCPSIPVLTQENAEKHRVEAEKMFCYAYGDNDRRDDNLRTGKALKEKYGLT